MAEALDPYGNTYLLGKFFIGISVFTVLAPYKNTYFRRLTRGIHTHKTALAPCKNSF